MSWVKGRAQSRTHAQPAVTRHSLGPLPKTMHSSAQCSALLWRDVFNRIKWLHAEALTQKSIPIDADGSHVGTRMFTQVDQEARHRTGVVVGNGVLPSVSLSARSPSAVSIYPQKSVLGVFDFATLEISVSVAGQLYPNDMIRLTGGLTSGVTSRTIRWAASCIP